MDVKLSNALVRDASLRVLTVVGARPQFIKAAAISRALENMNRSGGLAQFHEVLVHTGQHYDDEMSAAFFSELGLLTPAHNLGVGSGHHGAQTGEMLKRLEPVLLSEAPDLVLVYGDTNTTLAASLAAAKLNLPVAHVEAGLRSYRKDMPEEVNRVVTDHLSTLLFCPSPHSARNLEREGITAGVTVSGDVMFDVMLHHLPRADCSMLLTRLGLEPGQYALATVHRAENTDDEVRLTSIMAALTDLSGTGLPVILPLHPRTRQRLGDGNVPGVRIIKPAAYEQMLCLQQSARVILTDSGGIQKEAYWLGVPCVTLRDETEWPETVDKGWNVLAGTDRSRVVRAAIDAKHGPDRPPIYGEGNSAETTVRAIARWHQGQHEG
jgi:UDP-GlcNAc3NAcA epimerase